MLSGKQNFITAQFFQGRCWSWFQPSPQWTHWPQVVVVERKRVQKSGVKGVDFSLGRSCLYLDPRAFLFLFFPLHIFPILQMGRMNEGLGGSLLAKANPPQWGNPYAGQFYILIMSVVIRRACCFEEPLISPKAT